LSISMSTVCCCPKCWNFSGNRVRIGLRTGTLIPKEVISKVYLVSMSRDVQSRTHWLSPRNSPPPPYLDSYDEGTIGQQRKTTSLCNPLFNTVSGYSLSLFPFLFVLPRHFLVYLSDHFLSTFPNRSSVMTTTTFLSFFFFARRSSRFFLFYCPFTYRSTS
jgi:hypothetical protein